MIQSANDKGNNAKEAVLWVAISADGVLDCLLTQYNGSFHKSHQQRISRGKPARYCT